MSAATFSQIWTGWGCTGQLGMPDLVSANALTGALASQCRAAWGCRCQGLEESKPGTRWGATGTAGSLRCKRLCQALACLQRRVHEALLHLASEPPHCITCLKMLLKGQQHKFVGPCQLLWVLQLSNSDLIRACCCCSNMVRTWQFLPATRCSLSPLSTSPVQRPPCLLRGSSG